MLTGLDRLIADAEYVWDHLKWVKPGRGEYISDDLNECCGVGAAALLSLSKEELDERSREWGSDRIHAVLRAKYGVTDDQMAGFYEGFDGLSCSFGRPNEDETAGYKAGQELARRRFGVADSVSV